MDILEGLDWPGNVRELKNLIESVMVLERGNFVKAVSLEKYLPKSAAFYSVEANNRYLPVPVGKTPEESDRELILRALWEIKNDVVDLRNAIETKSIVGKLALPVPALEPDNKDNDQDEGGELNIEEMEKLLIKKALRKFYGNKQLAAKALGISMRSLYRKLQEFKLKDN